jgi:hypothetical protein
MRTTSTFERLLEKPLNAKYYAFDQDDQILIQKKRSYFLADVARIVVDILSMISKPFHRL